MRVRVVPIGGTTTDFLLDGIEIAEETASVGVTSYVGPGLISEISGTTRTIYHADGLGSTRAMSGSSQVVSESSTYDAYGNAVVTYGAAPNFGHAGQYRYYADATGLHYLKARYYAPVAGRFLSRDPIGYNASPNLYAYVDNNPIMFVDPSGELPWWVACVIPCGAAIGTPIAAIIGCLEGGCANTGTCAECFRQVMCEERYRGVGWSAACLTCLIGRWPTIQPKPPTPKPPLPPSAPPRIIRPGDPDWILPPNPIKIN